MDESIIKELITGAASMRKISYTPYSGFNVGAALLAKNGSIYTGCNIENASYTPTVCAERTAFFKAVAKASKSLRLLRSLAEQQTRMNLNIAFRAEFADRL